MPHFVADGKEVCWKDIWWPEVLTVVREPNDTDGIMPAGGTLNMRTQLYVADPVPPPSSITIEFGGLLYWPVFTTVAPTCKDKGLLFM